MNSMAQSIDQSVTISHSNAEQQALDSLEMPYLPAGFHACSGEKLASEPLMLLHGWGSDSQCWQSLGVQLNQYFDLHVIDLPGFGGNQDLSMTLDALLPLLPKTGIYLGWSLGGMLAAQLAHAYPQRVAALVTIAANAKFSESEDWPYAMPTAIFDNFKKTTQINTEKTLKRFAQLVGHSDTEDSIHAKSTLKTVRAFYSDAYNSDQHYALGLDWLNRVDNRQAYGQSVVPGLHLFASGDQLVPIACAAQLKLLNQSAPVVHEFEVLTGCHALHLENPAQLIASVCDFIQRVKPERSKASVAKSFSDAAQSYDASAQFQRDVGDELLDVFRENKNDNINTILDLGCGTGFFTSQLQSCENKNAGDQQVYALDIASGMLSKAKAANSKNALFVQADAENLPLKNHSIDQIYSNLAIQWCENPAKLLAEIFRAMSTNGQAHLSTLGPKSLSELKLSWQTVDCHQHINQFIDGEILLHTAQKVGFANVELTRVFKTLYFNDVKTLMREFKDIGAHNVNRGRAKGLSGKKNFQMLSQAYESLREDAGLPLTYEVYYLRLVK